MNVIDQRFHAIIQASTDANIVVDRDGIIKFANPAANLLFAQRIELGTMFGFPVVAGEITELDVLRRDGTIAIAEMRVVELEWEGEICYLALLRDITQHKQTQNELQALYNAVSYLFKSDSLLNLGHQIATAVVKEFSHVDCGVMLVKEGSSKIIRLARAGTYNFDPVYPLSLNGPGLVPEAIRTGQNIYVPDTASDPRYIENSKETRSELVIPLQTVNGIVGALDLQSTKIDTFTESHQRVLSAFAERAAIAIENVKLYEAVSNHAGELELRVAERTSVLKQTTNRLEAILDYASDAIIITDENGMIQRTNPAVFSLLGWTISEIQNVPLFHLFEDNRAEIDDAIRRATRDRRSTKIQLTGYRRDQSVFFSEMALAPISHDNHHIVNIVCIVRDITQHKQMEAELRKTVEKEKELNELKSRFVATASHEFRTPLTVIQASTSILMRYRDELSADRIDQKLNGIVKQVTHLTSIMEDVLDLGKLQSGHADFNPSVFDIHQLCIEIVEDFKNSQQEDTDILYDCELERLSVYLDKTLLRQVISNLISNAVKYSPTSKYVTVSLNRHDDEFELCVKDQGIGIPENDLKNLFEPFHRATNVGAIQGTGLGLSIIKEAIELHNGTIHVESHIGIGTTFVINLPINTSQVNKQSAGA